MSESSYSSPAPTKFLAWSGPPITVTGEVVSYSPDGGTDFSGNRCLSVGLKLLAPAVWRTRTTEMTAAAGETVWITATQVGLKSAFLGVREGQTIKLQYHGERSVPGSTFAVKTFSIDLVEVEPAQPPF